MLHFIIVSAFDTSYMQVTRPKPFVTCIYSYTMFCTAGDNDGLIKGKRYFTCPQKHGKIVRISNVVAVLPSKVSALLYTCMISCVYY